MGSRRADDFDADYYERGVQTGKSLYENYRWLGEPTVEMARHLVAYLDLGPGDRVLDFGCAKGYVVKALRILGVPAFGVDVSAYAIAAADPEVRPYCIRLDEEEASGIPLPHAAPHLNGTGSAFARNGSAGLEYEMVISKDVLEHVPAPELPGVLRTLRAAARRLFVVVPLGDGERFVVPEYEEDVTHEIRQPLEWWQAEIERAGWQVDEARYLMPGIKDAWAHYPRGNGFFVCRRAAGAGQAGRRES